MNRQKIIELLVSQNAVLIPLKDKQPLYREWQNQRQSHADALNPNSIYNIGVVLGEASDGLVDIDVDRLSQLCLCLISFSRGPE